MFDKDVWQSITTQENFLTSPQGERVLRAYPQLRGTQLKLQKRQLVVK